MNNPHRDIFTNRGLDFRKLKVIGYDMDYTLIHYHVEKWENIAYQTMSNHLKENQIDLGNVDFDPDFSIRGLIIDTHLGNLIKACRFGTVKHGMHGLRALSKQELESQYGKCLIDLADQRFIFLNTLFSLSTSCLYAQLINALNQGKLGDQHNYLSLIKLLNKAIKHTHLESKLKNTITSNPNEYIDIDPLTVKTLQEQKACGKKLFLATNSDWNYTHHIMSFAITPYLEGKPWQSLFDLIIVGAQKPRFFHNQDTYKVHPESGLLSPHYGPIKTDEIYHNCNAHKVEELFQSSGEDILYIGDHMYADINISKTAFGWRTCLIIRELENELLALDRFKKEFVQLTQLRKERSMLDQKIGQIELEQTLSDENDEIIEMSNTVDLLKQDYHKLNLTLRDKVLKFNQLNNAQWGLLLRSGKNKSHLARQIERYADIYTSRVSNFHSATPYRHFSSQRVNLPHDSAWIDLDEC
ncbi:MAG TPA: HAD-IG family 5'-nucleotidase [Gammaproteobacteria bacterium]|nr:HAD-IG family 5'-nucleotidase [Gammaproteobacteria bacterium]